MLFHNISQTLNALQFHWYTYQSVDDYQSIHTKNRFQVSIMFTGINYSNKKFMLLRSLSCFFTWKKFLAMCTLIKNCNELIRSRRASWKLKRFFMYVHYIRKIPCRSTHAFCFDLKFSKSFFNQRMYLLLWWQRFELAY